MAKTVIPRSWIVASLCLLLGGVIGIKGTLIGFSEAKPIYDQQVYSEHIDKTSGLIIKLDGTGDIIFNGLTFIGDGSKDYWTTFNHMPVKNWTDFMIYEDKMAAMILQRKLK